VVGATSLVGAIGHWRSGNVQLRTAALFGAVAMAGAFAGARLATFLPGALQLALLAIVMLGAAASMMRSSRAPARNASTNPEQSPVLHLGLLVPMALGVGLMTGIVGIGGGFLVVPALVLVAGLPMKQAIGTSLLVIAMNSLSGFAGYVGHVDVPWAFTMAFTAVAIGGILLGTYLVRFVSQATLKRAFALFLIVTGSFMLYKNRAAFHRSTDSATVAQHAQSEREDDRQAHL
jgi:hypothetical protein